ncbi:hypothetical protein GCM10009839_32820 [Catenulispora yoronensis]|uniref:Uncharacterized protein n=1 Tax=Catenulispora yoronensis TaxID=450799 RepID=A0ABN2U931_9ACTN
MPTPNPEFSPPPIFCKGNRRTLAEYRRADIFGGMSVISPKLAAPHRLDEPAPIYHYQWADRPHAGRSTQDSPSPANSRSVQPLLPMACG